MTITIIISSNSNIRITEIETINLKGNGAMKGQTMRATESRRTGRILMITTEETEKGKKNEREEEEMIHTKRIKERGISQSLNNPRKISLSRSRLYSSC